MAKINKLQICNLCKVWFLKSSYKYLEVSQSWLLKCYWNPIKNITQWGKKPPFKPPPLMVSNRNKRTYITSGGGARKLVVLSITYMYSKYTKQRIQAEHLKMSSFNCVPLEMWWGFFLGLKEGKKAEFTSNLDRVFTQHLMYNQPAPPGETLIVHQ